MQVGRVNLFWLGHDAFRIQAPGLLIYIDPVGIDPRFAAMLGEGEKADLVLLTHEHKNHCDPDVINLIRKRDGWIVGSRAAAQRVGAPARVVKANLSAEASAPEGTITMMFTDIVNSTAIKPNLGRFEGEWNHVWIERYQRPHHHLLRECINEHHGFEVKTIGDSFFVAFSDPVRAVRCAVDMQRRLLEAGLRIPLPGNPLLEIRIGLHTGPVVRQGTDYVGTSVDKAARIEGKAHGRQITISEQTYAMIQGQTPGLNYQSLGEFELKGLEGHHVVIMVDYGGGASALDDAIDDTELPLEALTHVEAPSQSPPPPPPSSSEPAGGGGLQWSGSLGGGLSAPSAGTSESTAVGTATAGAESPGGLRTRRVIGTPSPPAAAAGLRRPAAVPPPSARVATRVELEELGESFTLKGAKIRAVAAYNVVPGRESAHPRAAGHVGYLIQVDGKVIYHLGDTDQIPEMNGLGWIDVALVPVGGGNVMDAREAADCVRMLHPQIAVPMHYAAESDAPAQEFNRLVGDMVHVEVLPRAKF